MPFTVQTELKVRYAETDAMGVAHHAVYPVWFEVGRSDLMHALGLPYRGVEARGYYLMLSDLQVRYRRAARYDDTLILTTSVTEVRSRTATFIYELHRRDGAAQELEPQLELLATGKTHHIATDKNYRPARFPDDVLHLLTR